MKFTKALFERDPELEDYHLKDPVAMAQLEQLKRIADSLERILNAYFRR